MTAWASLDVVECLDCHHADIFFTDPGSTSQSALENKGWTFPVAVTDEDEDLLAVCPKCTALRLIEHGQSTVFNAHADHRESA